jgi:hypothetical protein
MNETYTAYPLSWPAGQRRTRYVERARFAAERSIAAARDGLLQELARLGAVRVVISSNLRLRQDGLPMGNQAAPYDAGVAVYFQLMGKPHVFACDSWARVQDNLHAIRLHIEALRGTERWGVGAAHQVFTGYRALPPGRTDAAPTPEQAADLLARAANFDHLPGAREALLHEPDYVAQAYRLAAKKMHPDVGGEHEEFVRLQEAKRVLDEYLSG